MFIHEKLVTLITLGESSVGKSSLSSRFCNNFFEEDYFSTIGVDFFSRNLTIDKKPYSVRIWDTAGQERYQTVTTQYLRRADGILLIFDLTKKNTFEKLIDWIKLIKKNTETKEMPKILLGNKSDLDIWEVTTEEVKKLSKDLQIEYFEVSAKSGKGVEEAFTKLLSLIPDKLSMQSKEKKNINIGRKGNKNKKYC